jgi:non-homologous end joining protein Ku
MLRYEGSRGKFRGTRLEITAGPAHTVMARGTDSRPKGGNVVDLMEALKRSIEGSSPVKVKTSRGGKTRA